jgi:hypothetical protein
MSPLAPAGRGAVALTSHVVVGATRAAAAVRTTGRPLHPVGRLRRASLHRHGLDPGLGLPFLDAPGTDEVLVRESRSLGLPGWLPDVHGLALRVPNPDGSHGDLLFVSSGWGRFTRYSMTLSRSTYGRPLTSLVPYRTAAGAVQLGLRQVTADVLALSCAVGRSRWRHVGDLVLSSTRPGPEVDFDPTLHTVPGLEHYAVSDLLQARSHHAARASRAASDGRRPVARLTGRPANRRPPTTP